MSYGRRNPARLSACNAGLLTVHPYLNPDVGAAQALSRATIDLTSPPGYPAGSRSIPVRLVISESTGLHQVLLSGVTNPPHPAAGSREVLACSTLAGESAAVVEFDYDGSIPSAPLASLSDPLVHPIVVRAVDRSGRIVRAGFGLHQLSPLHILTLEEPGWVSSLAFSHEGTRLATAARGSLFRLWDLERREIVGSFGPAPVSSVAFSPDGTTLATGAYDGKVRLWDVSTESITATLEGQPGISAALAFSPDGATLAAVSSDRTVTLWTLDTAEESAVLRHDALVSHVAFSPDGATLATATWNDQAHLWDPGAGAYLASLEGHGDWVFGVTFSPDGATLAASGSDGLVKLWDVRTRRELANLEDEWLVRGLAFSPDGATLACASGRVVRLWDTGTRVEIDTLPHVGLVEAVAFPPDGRTLVSGRREGVELWDASEWLKPRPHRLALVSGDGQQGSPGAVLESPLVVEVRDQYGNAIGGPPVTFTVTQGDGRLAGRFTSEIRETDANGRAEGRLTLGPGPEAITVEARLLGSDPVVFGAFAVETPLPPIEDGDPRKWHLPDLVTVRLGKGAMGTGDAVVFSPDGRRFAVATSIGIWVYDSTTARELALMADASVTSLAFSPDGGTLAGAGRTVRLWDVVSGENTATLEGHDGVESVAFSPDGSRLASASGTMVKLWDVGTGQNTATLDGHGGTVMFLHGGATVGVLGWNGALMLWDIASTPIKPLFQEHLGGGETTSFPERYMAFSPDGVTLAAGWRGSIRLWDVVAGTSLETLDNETGTTSVAFSPDGATLAVGSRGVIKLWDVTTGRVVTTLKGGTDWIYYLVFSPDGTTLASGSSNATRLWDVANGTELATVANPTEVGLVGFTPDGATLLGRSQDGILLLDVSTRNYSRLRGHSRVTGIRSVAFSPDGATLAAGSLGVTHLWDIMEGRSVATVSHAAEATSVAFSPDGTILALASYGKAIKLWDVAGRRDMATLESDGVLSLAFSPGGAAIAAGYQEGIIKLWDVAGLQAGPTLEGHTSEVRSVSFSPDGAALASGSSDETVRLWSMDTGREIVALEGHAGSVNAVAFSPDGATLAAAWANTDRVWDTATWEEVAPPGYHSHPLASVVFSPDGATLAAGAWDGTVALRETETWRRIAVLEGHTAGVTDVAFSPDGATLASGSRDGTALLWDVARRPRALKIVSGDGQQGRLDALLADSLVVEVTDQYGDLLEGAEVTFTVSAGGGTLTTETTTTDPAGRAATTLTLGSTPGPNTVEVAVEGLDPRLFTATAETTPDFDGDGEVGFADFYLFAEAFGGSDPRFDLDASGEVDFADFFLFAESFGQPQRAKLLALARERIGLPDGPQLDQNRPNPFNSETVISWFLLQRGPARLEVFALNGQRVAVLASGHHEAGLHRLHWDGRDGQGRPLASGTYLYRLVTSRRYGRASWSCFGRETACRIWHCRNPAGSLSDDPAGEEHPMERAEPFAVSNDLLDHPESTPGPGPP